MNGEHLEDLLHIYTPMEIGLFPGRLGRDPELDTFIQNLKFFTKSPRFVATDGKSTVMCDVSYNDIIIANYYKGDRYDEWVDIFENGRGSIMPDSMVKCLMNGYNSFELELFNWIYKHHADPDYEFAFSL